MLHNTPDSSNSEVLIIFPEQFDIDSCIIEVSTFYLRKKLRSLDLHRSYYLFFLAFRLYIIHNDQINPLFHPEITELAATNSKVYRTVYLYLKSYTVISG